MAAAGDPPQRIVSLAPNLTQVVTDLGGAERLAAVTPFCEAPAEVMRLPGGIQPEAEVVLELAPDLVLATSLTPTPTRAQLTSLGVRVEVIDADSLDSIREAVVRIASLLGHAPPSSAIPAQRTADRSAVLLFGAETSYSTGCGTHAHEILEAAGLRNLAAGAGERWPQLGEEFLLAADPDVIVVADYGTADRDSVLASLRRHPVRRHLAAVREGRVVVFPAEAFSVPGPAALSASRILREEVDGL